MHVHHVLERLRSPHPWASSLITQRFCFWVYLLRLCTCLSN